MLRRPTFFAVLPFQKHHFFQRYMSRFRIVEHVAKCQHIRQRPAAVELGHENGLRLAVKQYIPKDNPRPQPGDVTIIGGHANGFPKELYEPLWDDLLQSLQKRGRNIRSIWIADIVNQGQSGILNEKILGPDPDWFDHGRDLLFFINQHQDEMPQPIVGIGHSMGGMNLTHLALFHPRMFTSLVLIDPTITNSQPGKDYALLSTYRRDLWPSRKAAATGFKSSKFYQSWDERVLDKWLEYGLRDLPTEQYPSVKMASEDRPVTLTTTKAQEVYMFLRPGYYDERLLDNGKQREEDMHHKDIQDFPFYRSESTLLYRRLPELKPSVLYIFGETSPLSAPDKRQEKMTTTGVGLGGSGGAPKERVKDVVLNCGHLIPMELPQECADASAAFIDQELAKWSTEEEEKKQRWQKLSRRQRVEINDKWRENIGELPNRVKKDGKATMEKL